MSRQDEFLRTQKILRLVTISENGIPHVVPVWYIYSAKKFYIGTNSRTKKAKNLMKSKIASFCVDTGVNSPDIYGVMGYANAKLIREKSVVKRIAKKILSKYFESLENKSARELFDDTDCIIEIRPKKTFTWSY